MPVLRDTGFAIRRLEVEEEARIHLEWEQWPRPRQMAADKDVA